jgi:Chitobiase/beta-hexosaminidase C-terminal domain
MYNVIRPACSSWFRVSNAALMLFAVLICLSALSLPAQDKGKTAARPALAATRGEAVPDALVPTYVSTEPLTVSIKCATPGAILRYTLDGSTPTDAEDGMLYTDPIKVEKNSTIVAVAFKEGLAASPRVFATYLIGDGARPGLHTLHVGNSLTNTTLRFPDMARTAGRLHEYRSLTAPGALTRQLWDVERNKQKDDWKKALTELGRVDHLTVQPRDFNIAQEAAYDVKFFNLVREKSPDVQPWLYCEWVEQDRNRPTDKARVASSQMKKLYPALTWEESMAAMLLYVEELHAEVVKTYQGKKRPRVIPSAIALGLVCDMIDRGNFPGLKGGAFAPVLFEDNVHLNKNGAFLIDCTWYAAFYNESPEDKVLPVGTTLTPAQAKVMQRVAWDVVKNYPESGLFEEGATPVDKPIFAPPPMKIKNVVQLQLSPEAQTTSTSFRYTLDGTTPTRNRGYVYCGIISVRPGMTVKAVAIKSGRADSAVVEASYPAK